MPVGGGAAGGGGGAYAVGGGGGGGGGGPGGRSCAQAPIVRIADAIATARLPIPDPFWNRHLRRQHERANFDADNGRLFADVSTVHSAASMFGIDGRRTNRDEAAPTARCSRRAERPRR